MLNWFASPVVFFVSVWIAVGELDDDPALCGNCGSSEVISLVVEDVGLHGDSSLTSVLQRGTVIGRSRVAVSGEEPKTDNETHADVSSSEYYSEPALVGDGVPGKVHQEVTPHDSEKDLIKNSGAVMSTFSLTMSYIRYGADRAAQFSSASIGVASGEISGDNIVVGMSNSATIVMITLFLLVLMAIAAIVSFLQTFVWGDRKADLSYAHGVGQGLQPKSFVSYDAGIATSCSNASRHVDDPLAGSGVGFSSKAQSHPAVNVQTASLQAQHLPTATPRSEHLGSPISSVGSVAKGSVVPHGGELCPELLVPESSECTLLVPHWDPQSSSAPQPPGRALKPRKLDIKDPNGVVVLCVSVNYEEDASVHGSPYSSASSSVMLRGAHRRPPQIALGSPDDAKVFAYGRARLDGVGGEEMAICCSNGALFATLVANKGGSGHSLHSLAGWEIHFKATGTARSTVNVSDADGNLLSVIETKSGDERYLRVGPLMDAGLLVLCLVGMDVLSAPKYRTSRRPSVPSGLVMLDR